MNFQISDFLPREYREPSQDEIDFFRKYFYLRLKNTGYQIREENAKSIDKVVDFVVRLHLHRESKIIAENELKNAKHEFREPRESHTTLIAPPSRGLFLFGGCGTGKTSLLQRLSCQDKITTKGGQWFNVQSITYFSAEEIVENYAIEGVKYIRDNFSDNASETLIIDELGGEPKRAYYANGECMEDILRKRYDDYVTRGTLTVISSNLGSEELPLTSRYGGRIVSRLHEMCEPITFIGKDWRLNHEAKKA
jgi:DNA replication protein DnaC